MIAKSPEVSILMGIHNCASTLSEAIQSIQQQTFTDWEFIICDDG
ncbi:glycosyltransferase, partial [bacterium]|nr:glycosyltransferase [bacterium]